MALNVKYIGVRKSIRKWLISVAMSECYSNYQEALILFPLSDDVSYVPIGCFKDQMNDRALPEMLENYRVQTEKWPEIMKWNDLENTVIKKCARKV